MPLDATEGGALVLDGQNETNDETVQGQSLSENEDENHTSEEEGLLSVSADSSVSDNTNGHSSSQTGQTDRETSSEVSEALEGGVLILDDVGRDQDSNDETVDTDHTSHNARNDGLHHQLRASNSHGAHTDTSLSGSVGGTEASEDEGAGGAHEAEEEGGGGGSFGGGHLCKL